MIHEMTFFFQGKLQRKDLGPGILLTMPVQIDILLPKRIAWPT
jgi:hypothetical protein